jgi:uncharacterized protein YkwD
MIERFCIWFAICMWAGGLIACGGQDYSCDLDAAGMTSRVSDLRGESVHWSPVLAQAAQSHADDLARTGRAEHTGSDGSLPADRAQRAGWPSRYVGENVAAGDPAADQMTAQASWEASPGHRANMLYPGITNVGAACAMGGRYGVTWVQMLGGQS